MPSDLMDAISHASMILAWYEHIPEDEMPPRWMWELPAEIEDHFDRLKQKRKSGNDDEPIDGPQLRNEYARNRGANVR